MNNIPLNEKYTLTIKEAASYFNIGVKKMRRLAEEHTSSFSIYSGNRYLISHSWDCSIISYGYSFAFRISSIHHD